MTAVMHSRVPGLVCCAVVLLICGCRAQQVAHDGKGLRQAMVDIYTEQALDNLVKARSNRPFVQLTYRDLLVQDTDTFLGEISNAQATTSTRQITAAAAVSRMFTRTVMNTLTPKVNAQRAAQMSFHADVVTDKNDVYQKYMAFAHDDAYFTVSPHKPVCKPKYIKKEEGMYFYVPPESEFAFQDLVLRTAFLRGPEATTPGYYECKILDVFEKDQDPRHADTVNTTVRLDKKIPNGTGTMIVYFRNGRTAQLDILPETPVRPSPPAAPPVKPVDKDPTENVVTDTQRLEPIPATQKPPSAPGEMASAFVDVPLGQPTDKFDALWNTKKATTNFSPNDIKGLTVRIFSHDYPPPLTQPSETVQQIRDDLDRIRATQVGPIGASTNLR